MSISTLKISIGVSLNATNKADMVTPVHMIWELVNIVCWLLICDKRLINELLVYTLQLIEQPVVHQLVCPVQVHLKKLE